MDKELSATKHESLEKLELLWAKIESDFKPFNREVSVADNPISAFTYYLEMGNYPPPEIMVEVMDSFLEYFNSRGDRSLDEAFFGTKHKKYGSVSYKQDYSLRYSAFEWFIFKGEFTSLDDAAEEFLKPIAEEIDQDTIDKTLKGMRIIEQRSSGMLSFVQKFRDLTLLPEPQKSEIRN